MREDDLIKKLNNVELPEIEIKSHKRKLRTALFNSDYFQKSRPFEFFKKSLVFVAPSLILLIVLGINIIQPRLIEARALSIARTNPEIKRLMEEKDMVLSQVKVKDKKAYILLNPPEEVELMEEKDAVIKIQKAKEDEIEDVEGAIIEVNLEQKEIIKINPIKWNSINPLPKEEKESAREIAEAEEILEGIIPEGAKIEKIQSFLPKKIRLIEKDDGVKIVPQPDTKKTAQVHYILNGKRWVIKVNLSEKRVEEIKYSSDKQLPKGRK